MPGILREQLPGIDFYATKHRLRGAQHGSWGEGCPEKAKDSRSRQDTAPHPSRREGGNSSEASCGRRHCFPLCGSTPARQPGEWEGRQRVLGSSREILPLSPALLASSALPKPCPKCWGSGMILFLPSVPLASLSWTSSPQSQASAPLPLVPTHLFALCQSLCPSSPV